MRWERPGVRGVVTRGTTNPNRLRRVDRYIADVLAPRLTWPGDAPTVVDLGYGAVPVTAVELHERLRRRWPSARLVGVEIDQARVDAAAPWARPDRTFLRGGFEVPLPAGWERPTVLRAFNVLRQYDEDAVADAWRRLRSRLAPGGVLVEGTCDEIGRRASWVTLDASGPCTFTISLALMSIERPSDVAERLPKALIHHHVPGHPVHAWLAALDRAWDVAAPLASVGVRQRWIAAVQATKDAGWPVLDRAARWRLGEVSVPWWVVSEGRDAHR